MEKADGERMTDILEMGWALKSRATKVTFNDNQRQYLTDIFNDGQKTGNNMTQNMSQR